MNHLTKNLKYNNLLHLRALVMMQLFLILKIKKVVVSTDLLIEGVHFDLAYMPLKHLGYKAVVVNVSDICAMNARRLKSQFQQYLTVFLEALEELFDGITCSGRYKVDVIGETPPHLKRINY
jgi:thiamine-monophosphate kinase